MTYSLAHDCHHLSKSTASSKGLLNFSAVVPNLMATALQEEMISPNPNQLGCDCRQNDFKELPGKIMGRFPGLLLITNTSHTVTLNQGGQPRPPGAGRKWQERDIHSAGEVKRPCRACARGKGPWKWILSFYPPGRRNRKAVSLGGVSNGCSTRGKGPPLPFWH